MVSNKKIRFLILLLILLVPYLGFPQCAMCRAVLESGESTDAAEGVNNGIVFLMAIPYILVGVVGFIIYKKIRN